VFVVVVVVVVGYKIIFPENDLAEQKFTNISNLY